LGFIVEKAVYEIISSFGHMDLGELPLSATATFKINC
jgi:hypothetical protein